MTLHDGVATTVDLIAATAARQTNADALLAEVRAHWQALGYTVDHTTFGSGLQAPSRLMIDLGFASVALDINPQRGTARLSGTTDCLAPS